MDRDQLRQQKAAIRQQSLARRHAQPDKDELSRRILANAMDLPDFRQARTVAFYIGVRSEVRTRPALPSALASGQRIVVPWCDGDELRLFHLGDVAELAPAGFGLLEPPPGLRESPERQVATNEVDVFLVPGVAFDRRGARCGHGKGYYDRLLRRARPDALLIGLGFDCQVFPEIPAGEHDIFMDVLITEAGVLDPGRKLSP